MWSGEAATRISVPDRLRFLRMAPIVIYTRRECGLCHEATDAIAPIAKRRGVSVELVDVDRDAELVRLYGNEVPVVFVNGRKAFKFRVDVAKLESLLERGTEA